LREMVLAGGALAVTACGGSTSAQADAAAGADTGSDDQSSDDAFTNPGPEFPCCNANSDPCCPLLCSGDIGPDAAVYVDCEQEGTQCEAMNGFYEAEGNGSPVCVLPRRLADSGAAPTEAGPTDAADDVQAFLFCCNANPDPCCPIAFCAGGVGPDGGIYVTCEQNRTQCEVTNGSYEPQPDGSLGCTPTSAAGH
jgi:hypothetical protein